MPQQFFLKLLNVRSCQILKQKGENLWPYYQHLIVHLITDGCDIIVQYPRSELFLNILMTRKLMHFRTQLNIFACSTVVWGFPVWIRQLAIVSLTKLNPALNNYSLICQIVNTAFVLHFWIQKRRTRHISLNFARIKKCQKTKCHYFSILKWPCFLTFFDPSEIERATAFPSDSKRN